MHRISLIGSKSEIRFPSCPAIRTKWVEAFHNLNSQEIASCLPKTSRICKLHFSSDCFEQFGFSSIRLKPNSVPSIFPRARKQSAKFSKLVLEASTNIIDKQVEASIKEIDLAKLFDDEVQMENLSEEVQDVSPIHNDHDEMMNFKKDNVIKGIIQTPKKLLRYPGDINDNILQNITPRTSIRIIKMLKKECQKKDKIIKRCRTQQNRQKKKIEHLTELLFKVRKKCLL
ncbi:uncharacterized protein [Linepithema humile]|uniref:uncharacterized protein isoform X2 n=1 Tax=Linepithema humile TaxID=83485 RepID=UPI00351E4C16